MILLDKQEQGVDRYGVIDLDILDPTFLAYKAVSMDTLKKYVTSGEAIDFNITDGVLYGTPQLATVDLSAVAYAESKEECIFSLFSRLLQDNALYVKGSVKLLNEQPTDVGSGDQLNVFGEAQPVVSAQTLDDLLEEGDFTYLRDLRYSASSLSVYMHSYIDDAILVEKLVAADDTKYFARKFAFISVYDYESPYVTLVKTLNVNDVACNVYVVDGIPVVPDRTTIQPIRLITYMLSYTSLLNSAKKLLLTVKSRNSDYSDRITREYVNAHESTPDRINCQVSESAPKLTKVDYTRLAKELFDENGCYNGNPSPEYSGKNAQAKIALVNSILNLIKGYSGTTDFSNSLYHISAMHSYYANYTMYCRMLLIKYSEHYTILDQVEPTVLDASNYISGKSFAIVINERG